jgi:aspartate racemase
MPGRPFKKIGIVGGVAWPSTVVYYSEICRLAEQWHVAKHLPGPPSMPEIVIESLDHSKAVFLLGRESDEASWSRFDDYHRAALQRLEACGAEVAAIASNTPHHRFESIARGIRIPVISIVDAAARQCVKTGARQVLILGTELTMKSTKFRETFAKHAIEAAGPADEASRAATMELSTQLQANKLQGARQRLENIARAAFAAQFDGPPVVCLACTELPLAFGELASVATFDSGRVSYINTTAAHINAIFDFAVAAD